MDKYLRQRDENEGRPRARVHIVGEAGGEDNETGHDRYKCIQSDDTDRLTAQCAVLRNICAENLHRSDTEGQREERLVHGRRDDISKTHLGCS